MIGIDVDTAVAIPVNIYPLIDDTDFKTRETTVVYDQAGMDLVWNFVTSAGVMTQTAITPTTGGVYDWTHVGDAMYKIEIPASGGGSINNDTEGYGWFSGICTGVLAWVSPRYVFRAASINDALVDGGDVLDVSLTEIGGVAQSATDLKGFADSGYDPATNKVQGVVLVDTVSTLTGHTVQTGDTYADWANGGRLDLLLDAIKLVTDALPDSGALTTIGTDTARLTATRAAVLTDWINGGRLDLLLDDVLARIPAALVSGRMSSDVVSISGSTDAADKLKASAKTIVIGAAATGTLSITQMSTNLTETTNDHYNGRVILWTSGALIEQSTAITDYNGATKVLTFTTVTEAPLAADTFVIV